MKVIFLDFDGVLNSAAWMKARYEENKDYTKHSFLTKQREELDPTRVKMISDLAVATNSDIVISSSWRILHDVNELCDFLVLNGLDPSVMPIGVTPKTRKGFRGDEVQMWLDENPQVTTHVIFDDDGDFYPHQPLVKTSWDVGLCESHIDIARGILLNTNS